LFKGRVQRLFLSMSYIMIFRWTEMCGYARQHEIDWPLLPSLNASLTRSA
jgi:hypothetical protein